MEISITTLIVIAIMLVAAGLLLLLVWPLFQAGKSKDSGSSVTVKGNDSIVTVRSAGGDVSVFFGQGEQSRAEQIVPAAAMSDSAAEQEVTILDELRDPGTSPDRRAAIEKELLALGYRIERKPQAPRTTSGKMASQKEADNRPERKPASEKPSEPDEDSHDTPSNDSVDEGLGEQEPQFDDFYAPSE